jgi:hypothetical protein
MNEQEIRSMNVVTAEDIGKLIAKYGKDTTLGSLSISMYEASGRNDKLDEEEKAKIKALRIFNSPIFCIGNIYDVLKDGEYVPMVFVTRINGVLYFLEKRGVEFNADNDFKIGIMEYIRNPAMIKFPSTENIINIVDVMLKYERSLTKNT